MNLQDVFDQLTFGELSQLSIGGGEAGAISEANYPRVLAHINLGLTALYKRFPLKEGRVSVTLAPGQLLYPLSAVAPDLLKIEQVRTDGKDELPLNDESDEYSVFTPVASTLRVPDIVVAQSIDLPDWLKTINLEVVYRANHPKVVQRLGYFDPKRERLQLPDTHFEPLLLFVASRAMTPMGAGQFEGQGGNNYFAKYEAACAQLEATNLRVDQGAQNSRLHRNGWV